MTDEQEDDYVFDISECPIVEDIEETFDTEVRVERTGQWYSVRCSVGGDEFGGGSEDLDDAVWAMLDDLEANFKAILSDIGRLKAGLR
jgi:hypothetical protein